MSDRVRPRPIVEQFNALSQQQGPFVVPNENSAAASASAVSAAPASSPAQASVNPLASISVNARLRSIAARELSFAPVFMSQAPRSQESLIMSTVTPSIVGVSGAFTRSPSNPFGSMSSSAASSSSAAAAGDDLPPLEDRDGVIDSTSPQQSSIARAGVVLISERHSDPSAARLGNLLSQIAQSAPRVRFQEAPVPSAAPASWNYHVAPTITVADIERMHASFQRQVATFTRAGVTPAPLDREEKIEPQLRAQIAAAESSVLAPAQTSAGYLGNIFEYVDSSDARRAALASSLSLLPQQAPVILQGIHREVDSLN